MSETQNPQGGRVLRVQRARNVSAVFVLLLSQLRLHSAICRAAVFYGYKEVCDHGPEFLRQLWAHVAQCTVVESRALGGVSERGTQSMLGATPTKDGECGPPLLPLSHH